MASSDRCCGTTRPGSTTSPDRALATVEPSCNHVSMTATAEDTLGAWFAGRLPDGWSEGAPEVDYDNDEILVVLPLPAAELGGDATPAAIATAEAARIKRFREETREQRMRVAHEAEHR